MSSPTGKQAPRVCIGVIILNSRGELLLLRSHKFKNKWIVPGGGIEWGEQAEDTAKREALEETGLRITDITFLGAEECIFPAEFHKQQHFIFFDFYAKTFDTQVTLNDEAEEFRWIRPEKASTMDLNTSTRGFIKKYLAHTQKNQ